MPNGSKSDKRNANLGDINTIYKRMNQRFDKIDKKLDDIEEDLEKRMDEKIENAKSNCEAYNKHKYRKRKKKKEYAVLTLIITAMSFFSSFVFRLLGVI